MKNEPRRAVIGDRLCPACGYNLVGQDIVREQHYQMLIIRCPECGGATSVQEYPSLARWGRRLSFILVAVWLVFILALWIGTGTSLGGMAVGAGHIAAEGISRDLDEAHNEWSATKLAEAGVTPSESEQTVRIVMNGLGGPMMQSTSAPTGVDTSFATWWAEQDTADLIASAGGWSGAVDWMMLWLCIPIVLVGVLAGCLWATILARQRRIVLTLLVPVLLFMSVLVIGPLLVGWAASPPWSSWDAAPRIIAPPVIGLMLAFGGVALWLGLMIGRPLTRALVTFALPPRMSGWLDSLWTIDGKQRR